MTDAGPWKLDIHQTISAIPPAEWNRCANPADRDYNPFLDHAFLRALEESGSAVPETGWGAHHLSVTDTRTGKVRAVMPLYLKGHSQGEYIFDHGWADAFHRAGGEYYPKLLCAIPFTPASGRRLLTAPGDNMDAVTSALARGAADLTEKLGLSSLHLNFLTEQEWHRLGDEGFLLRTDQQFHWLNAGYRKFDDFLADLASRKRKNLKKERQKAVENGIEIEWVTGNDLTEAHWDAFYGFYLDTGYRKWGEPYLKRDFFSRIQANMADKTLLIMAKRDSHYIAGALNFIGSETLYGRHWGCSEDHPFLHFECCYYQAIDFAISKGLKRVEAGAQGTHKLARGYVPTRTYSAHHIPHEGFRTAVENYLEQERRHVDNDMSLLSTHTPFKQQDQNHE
ncbi:MAG: GNAT family N-acetyltransferase [Parvibaculales bacterium]